MSGVSLSKWTMSYFVAALLALICGEALMAAGYGFPAVPVYAPQTLVLVHLIAIGWLSLLMCGALFQFVPVLIARPLHSDRLPFPTLLCLVTGLCLLITGFLQLGGTIIFTPSCLPYAATLLCIGFSLALYNLGRTLWQARPLPLQARFVAVALVCLLMAVTFGTIFSFGFALPLSSDFLSAIAAVGLPLHITAGLGGWLTFAAMGVSYRLLAMFMLSAELDGKRPQAVFWLGTLAAGIVIFGGLSLLVIRTSLSAALYLGGGLGLAACVLYGLDMLHLYRARKRRQIELNSQMAACALLSLAFAVFIGAASSLIHPAPERVGALVFLVAFGWLGGLGLSKLYKIIAFLTWLECYGPVLGKMTTPRVQDLVVESRARPWFGLYYIAVWTATASLCFGQADAFRLAAGAMLLATLAIAHQMMRTRKLSNIPAGMKIPAGVQAPCLLFSTASRR